MRLSLPRLVRSTPPLHSLLGSSCAPLPPALPPVRYHVFPSPLPYPTGLALQTGVIKNRLAARAAGKPGNQDVLFLLEHTPTYTTGRRDNTPNPDELHPEEKKVQDVGAGFFITKRGGQVTYHGPGQIVGYPILDLNAMGTPTRCYVEYLQALLKNYCEDLGADVVAPHADGHVGVFRGRGEKVASIGIHLSHRITSHGFAMNVTEEPKAWFDLVTACGLDDVRAVSLADLVDKPLGVKDVAEALVPRFADVYAREFIPLEEGEEPGDLGEEIEGIKQLVRVAEEEAAKALADNGGVWPTRPNPPSPPTHR